LKPRQGGEGVRKNGIRRWEETSKGPKGRKKELEKERGLPQRKRGLRATTKLKQEKTIRSHKKKKGSRELGGEGNPV